MEQKDKIEFHVFADAIRHRFETMSKHPLYVVDIGKDELWHTYLDSFPEGTKEIYKERREHDCNLCSQFVKRMGNVVALIDGVLVSVWDVAPGYPYTQVAQTLDKKVSRLPIRTVFLYDEKKISQSISNQLLEDNKVLNWDHFSCELPDRFVTDKVAAKRGATETTAAVFRRGLEELTKDALNTVKDLISDGAIYRGEEFKGLVDAFIKLKNQYDATNPQFKSLIVWENVESGAAKFRNTVIGTLVTDLSDDMDLEKAVELYEAKVAPQDYKRSSAVITKAMG